jgi:hypothetical protein
MRGFFFTVFIRQSRSGKGRLQRLRQRACKRGGSIVFPARRRGGGPQLLASRLAEVETNKTVFISFDPVRLQPDMPISSYAGD